MIDIYETPYGTVEIDVDAQRVVVAVSSGFDSALLLYATALAAKKYNPTLEIYTVTARRVNSLTEPHLREVFDRVDNYANAVKVVEWVRSCFPEIDIKDNILHDAYFWQYCQDDMILGKRHTYIMSQKMPYTYAVCLPYQNDTNFKYNVISLSGVTKNPDFELGGNNPETQRNLKLPNDNPTSVTVKNKSLINPLLANYMKLTNLRVLLSEPFRNGDKRVTFWLADNLGILDNLLAISRSCEGPRDLSNNWTEECHHCWWCYERTWAHETYKDQQPYDQDKYKSTNYFNALKDRS